MPEAMVTQTSTLCLHCVCHFEVGDPEDRFHFHSRDLVRAQPSQLSQQGQQLCPYQGGSYSRRELVLITGSLEDARTHWAQHGPASEADEWLASCIRGHFLHARCFQGCLFAGQGCPECPEALFVPTLKRERTDDEDDCHRVGGGPADNHGVETVLESAAEAADAVQQDVEAGPGNLEEAARMCPLCYAGPVQLMNCQDLESHRGQCPQCNERPCTAAALQEALAGTNAGDDVMARVPRCKDCNVAVIFNGCMQCGHLFSRWTDLPEFDPAYKSKLDASDAFLRAVKLLAAQVRSEAAQLAHERLALQELQNEANHVGCPDGDSILRSD